MPDFGTVLPFLRAAAADPNAWCVYMLEIAPEEITIWDGEAVKLEEAWGYFVWLPQGVRERDFGEPELWGVTRSVPYEEVFSLVEKQPVYLIPESLGMAATLGGFILRNATLTPRERKHLVRKVLAGQSEKELQRLRAFTIRVSKA
jgi:hypothetical protein